MNFYKKYKLAFRGNIPKIEDPDIFRDPYQRRSPNDGQGPKMTTPGDEEGYRGFGRRFRGTESPSGFSSTGDYEEDRTNDIPTQDTVTIRSKGDGSEDQTGGGIGEGANDGRFVDFREKLVDTTSREPIGPHNMQKYKTVTDRTNRELQGV